MDPQAIADCKAFRDQAWAYVNAEMERINSTCAAHINKSDYFELIVHRLSFDWSKFCASILGNAEISSTEATELIKKLKDEQGEKLFERYMNRLSDPSVFKMTSKCFACKINGSCKDWRVLGGS